MKVTCDWCGKEFNRWPSAVQNHNFCSRACYSKWYRETFRGTNHPLYSKVTTTCDECDSGISIPKQQYLNHEHHFCSNECRLAWFSRDVLSNRLVNHLINCVCEYCGKDFKRARYEVKKYEHCFCSRECRENFKRLRKLTKDELNKLLENKTFKKLEAELNIPHTTLHRWAQEHGLKHRKEAHIDPPRGSNHPAWKGGYNTGYRGWQWQKYIRPKILERDGFCCQMCGFSGNNKDLHIHHIIPFREFNSPLIANTTSNLITLCNSCHRKIERGGVELHANNNYQARV